MGPAIGGIILAATNAGTVFLANAVTFIAVIAVIAAWHSTRAPAALPRTRGYGRYPENELWEAVEGYLDLFEASRSSDPDA